jgi:predicted O-methyltransferase YrrM
MNERDLTAPRADCEHPEYWTAEDEFATENEVIEGVAGLIRMLQPIYVIETGTHRGFMAEAIGHALLQNGHGHLDTIEIEPALYTTAKNRVRLLPVTVHPGDAAKFQPIQPIDFAWFDSGSPDQRETEFRAFYCHMRNQALVGFHDTGTHYPAIREAVLHLQELNLLKPIFLRTPRGVALCEVTR